MREREGEEEKEREIERDNGIRSCLKYKSIELLS